jgi:hypothetical protein
VIELEIVASTHFQSRGSARPQLAGNLPVFVLELGSGGAQTILLTFHPGSTNYFRLARRPKVGHDSISVLQRRFSQSLDELPH